MYLLHLVLITLFSKFNIAPPPIMSQMSQNLCSSGMYISYSSFGGTGLDILLLVRYGWSSLGYAVTKQAKVSVIAVRYVYV